MKLLTILTSKDMDSEVEREIDRYDNITCYVKLTEAEGISHRCKQTLGENMPWEAVVLMVTGEEKELVELAESVKARLESHDFKPCLRMMLSPVDKVWM